MNDIKPCPCGGEARLERIVNYPLLLQQKYYYVRCTKCTMHTNIYTEKKCAIATWNLYCFKKEKGKSMEKTNIYENEKKKGKLIEKTNTYEEMWNGLRGYFKYVAESEQNIYVTAVFSGLYQLMRDIEKNGLPALVEETIKLEGYK